MDTAMTPKREHVVYLDVLRSLATYLVVILHCITPTLQNSDYFRSAGWMVLDVINSFVRMGVPIFFMISGYLALSDPRERPIREYYLGKVRRVLVPLLIWDVIYFLFNCHCGIYDFSLRIFFSELMVQGSKYHLWFVYQIFAFYLLTPFLKKMVSQCTQRQLWLLMAVLLSSTSILPTFNKLTSLYIAPWGPLLEGYLGFYLYGYVLGRSELNRKARFVVYLGGILGMAIGIWGNAQPNADGGVELWFNYGASLTHYLLAGATFQLVRELSSRKNRFIKTVGLICGRISKISFGIYFVHILVLEEFQMLAVGVLSTLSPLPYVAATAIVSCVVSTLIAWVLSKFRYLRRLV